MDVALRAVEAAGDAPSLSRHLEREGTRDQMLEFIVHRSAYQLKEADPHSWALPRLTGAPKAAMVEIQADEYGGGDAARMHSALFAKSMNGLVRQDPALSADVIWGARALVELEGRFARRLLEAWAQGRSSLLERLVSA
jgi:hypothetical protein